MFLVFISCKKQEQAQVSFSKEKAKKALQFATKQYEGMILSVLETNKFPRTTHKDGTLGLVGASDWTSGFYPGTLWYLYEFNTLDLFKTEAITFTNLIENQQNNTHTHDLGFMLYCSYGNAYRIHKTKQEDYSKVLLQGAKSLSGRFNDKVGAIKSWDWNKEWEFPVIVDNMMNLEYLFWATKKSGDSIYYNQAISHADLTIKNHFRKDNSTVHVVNYNPNNGEISSKFTVQGYADNSIWARGQAWALYGFTMMYRETGDVKYLNQATKIAHLIVNHKNMPADLIPYWDYDAPTIPNAPRDSSAAAIIASALLELQSYVDIDLQRDYMNKATTILSNLGSSEYTAKLGENNHFILKHATGYLPKGKEIDVPLNYADYYYIEALTRYLTLKNEL